MFAGKFGFAGGETGSDNITDRIAINRTLKFWRLDAYFEKELMKRSKSAEMHGSSVSLTVSKWYFLFLESSTIYSFLSSG